MQPRNDEIYSNRNREQDFIASSSKTTLRRTELTPDDKVLFSANALAREHEHGSKSEPRSAAAVARSRSTCTPARFAVLRRPPSGYELEDRTRDFSYLRVIFGF